jgi:hypothetical protein
MLTRAEIFKGLKSKHADVSKILACICGPVPMKNDVAACCQHNSSPKLAFDFHEETFEL